MIASVLRAQTLLEKADQSFAIGDYTMAIKDYEKAFKKEKDQQVKNKIAFKVGECYKEKNLLPSSEKWYKQAIELGYSSPIVYLKLGDVLVNSEKYSEAIEKYNKYVEAEPNDNYAQKQIVSCRYAIENLSKTANFSVKNEVSINSDKGEYGVGFLPNVAIFGSNKNKSASKKFYDQQFRTELEIKHNIIYIVLASSREKDRIVFSSNRQRGGFEKTDAITGQGNDNIYEALYDVSLEKWMNINALMGSINSSKNEAFFSFCEAEKLAYFSQYNNIEGKTQQIGNIFVSKYNEITNTWSEPTMFPYNSATYDIVHPTVSADGNTLYFVSNMEGGQGGYDIYAIERDSNKVWGQPINLGSTINTPYNELFPFFSKKNELFFTSTGHPGFGGQDVFMSYRQKDKTFSPPQNMGKPINSSADDFGLISEMAIVNGNEVMRGYFSSNRTGGVGLENDDIYSFYKVSPTYTLKGNVKDKYERKNIAGIRVILEGKTDYKNDVTITDENGNFVFTGLDPKNEYDWKVDDEEYISEVKNIDPKDSVITTPKDTVTSNKTGFDTNIKVIKISKKEINLNNIYYDYGKADLRYESTKELDTLAEILKGNPEKYIIISSYTDAQSSDEFNYYLSQKRAQKVIDYIVSKGLQKGRFFAMGYGESNLVKKDAQTEEEHQMNRRTTFKILTDTEFNKHIANAAKYNPAYKRYGNQPMPEWVAKIFDGTTVVNDNIKTNNTNITVNNEVKSGLEFRVQFIAVKSPLNAIYYKRIEETISGAVVKSSLGSDNIYRYYLANYTTMDEATRIQKKLMEIGYESVIFPYYNGERISFSKAKSLTN